MYLIEKRWLINTRVPREKGARQATAKKHILAVDLKMIPQPPSPFSIQKWEWFCTF
jgi:hypothetical protein